VASVVGSDPAPDVNSKRLGQYHFLFRQIKSEFASTTEPISPATELSKYLAEVQGMSMCTDVFAIWHDRKLSYPLLCELAEDLVSAPT